MPTEVPVEITAALTAWQGQPAIIVIVRDIASRKRAEAELFREKERAQVTLESIGDGVITTDVAGRIDYLKSGRRGTYRLEQCPGERPAFGRRFPGQGREYPQAVAGSGAALSERTTQYPLPDNALLMHRGGYREFSIEITASPIRNHADTVIGAVLVLHDVTTLRNMARQWPGRHGMIR